jgi:hypothetical protein
MCPTDEMAVEPHRIEEPPDDPMDFSDNKVVWRAC